MAEIALAQEWRIIQSYPDYEASNDGLIRRAVDHHRFPQKYPAGYVVPQSLAKQISRLRDGRLSDNSRMAVGLFDPRRRKSVKLQVARLVCEAFHGAPPTPRHEAAHNDGDRLNNASANLRWATSADNHADKRLHGTNNAGTKHGMSKITDADVSAIRRAAASGMTQKAVAVQFGISQANASLINARKAWGHIP